jgi:hypothetical protein
MGNLFVNLPMPVGNGPGAAVDTSGMGKDKTVTVDGSYEGATIAIEVSEDAGGAGVYAPATVFQSGDKRRLLEIAARFMRVNVTGRKSSVPFSANADVGASDMGGLFGVIPMPAGNGPGAPLDVSAFGSFCTFVVGGAMAGTTIVIEVSEDGVDYAPVCVFSGYGGQQSAVVTGNFIRANVTGRKAVVPFSATASVGAVNDPAAPMPVPTNWQSFDYVATGLEGQTFTVPIPVAQPDALYQVRYSFGARFRQFTLDWLPASRLVAAFDVEVSTEPHEGDIIHFDVFNPPP